MKKLFCLFVIGFSFFHYGYAVAEGYADIKTAHWSKDETHFVLGFGNQFDTGDSETLESYLVLSGSGKILKREENFNEPGATPSPKLQKEIEALYSQLELIRPVWLAKDPLTFANQAWPCCYPPKLGGHYSQKILLNGRKATLSLHTFATKGSLTETGYRLSVKIAGEKSSRVLAEWERPKNENPNTGRNFTLGAIGLSPTGDWIVVFLRRFDYGFESSDAVPVPLFFTTASLSSTAK